MSCVVESLYSLCHYSFRINDKSSSKCRVMYLEIPFMNFVEELWTKKTNVVETDQKNQDILNRSLMG